MLEKIDFKSGQVILNDFDFDDTIPLEEQIWSFKHDILQVRYDKGLILDLGWLPEFNLEDGIFTLVIVKNQNWSNPIFTKRTKSLKEIYEYIKEAIDLVESLKN